MIEEFNKIVSDNNIKEADATFTPELFDDTYLNMELALARDAGETTFASITKRLKDVNGLPIGTSHKNPILDTRVYEVEYEERHKASMAANTMATKLFAKVTQRAIAMRYSTKLLITVLMAKELSNRTHS